MIIHVAPSVRRSSNQMTVSNRYTLGLPKDPGVSIALRLLKKEKKIRRQHRTGFSAFTFQQPVFSTDRAEII